MKRKRTRQVALGVMFGLIILLSAQSSLAWKINPAKWILYHKEDFEIETYEWPLELTNDGDAPIEIKLSIMEPEYVYDGNVKMPDLKWVSISKKNLEIGPESKERVLVTIDINNKSQAYNQSWEFWIFADQTAGAGNIQTDYKCRWTLQTPIRFVPIEERPGYVPWGTIMAYFGILGGAFVIIILIYKKGLLKKKSTKNKNIDKKPISMREHKKTRKVPKRIEKVGNRPQVKRDNVIRYKKKS